ncbi:hypothetical protein HII31_07624 [Pseudocercospora fuligena]|uniref:Uncharacterized protein n=1 Tax=Pseudocercospora fuligena TaxID=685502 RepID=A0A8H6RGG6_9PEZI|nr:hypothetical protein HII31_07624 [Pseudocercospora fuligena]
MICHDDYEPEDFQRLEQIADFLKLPALQGVILIPETRGMLASMTKEQQVWEANLQSLEDFINQRIQNKQPVLCDEPPQAFTKQPKDLRPATSSELFQYAPMRTRGSTFGEI